MLVENHMTDKNNNDTKVTLLNSTRASTESLWFYISFLFLLFLFNNLLYINITFFPDSNDIGFFFVIQKKNVGQQSIFGDFGLIFFLIYVVVKGSKKWKILNLLVILCYCIPT